MRKAEHCLVRVYQSVQSAVVLSAWCVNNLYPYSEDLSNDNYHTEMLRDR